MKLDLDAFWMPFTANRAFKKNPRMFVAAKDMHYTTDDGRQVLDGTAGLWCCNAGHGREKIVKAVQELLRTGNGAALTANDNWATATGGQDQSAAIAAAAARVGAFPLAAGSKDAALYGTGINAAGYTIQLAGKAGTVGTGLIELYDPAAAASITVRRRTTRDAGTGSSSSMVAVAQR